MKFWLLSLPVVFLFMGFALSAQEVNLRTFDYSKADSIALHLPKGKYKTYRDLVEPLTLGLQIDQEKFRAIYRWITDNISYSFSNRTGDAGQVLRKRKAVCAGYSALLKEMCNYAGLECNIIEGLAKNVPGNIGQKEINHAWNEVLLDGRWYLTDVTWASGSYDLKKRKFYKDFDTAYYLPSPEFFIKQHLPTDKKKQMLDTLAKKPMFIKSPVWYEDDSKYGFSVIKPLKGHVNQNVKKDFAVTISLGKLKANKDSLPDFYFMVDQKPEQYYKCSVTTDADSVGHPASVTIKCRFPEKLKGGHDVDIYYGGEALSGFRVNFH